MSNSKFDKIQTKLNAAIDKDAPCELPEPLAVLVTLDNGVKYKGYAYEVLPKGDVYTDGLVMVHTDKGDMGVPVTYLQGR